MTVEAYLRARVPGYPFETAVIEDAVLSPIFAKPAALRAISMKDVIEDNADDEGFVKSLKYATSTLFYAASGVFSGGSRSEQVGDVHASLSGFEITREDREYYRAKADRLRHEVGAAVEDNLPQKGGAFDISGMGRNQRPYSGWIC